MRAVLVEAKKMLDQVIFQPALVHNELGSGIKLAIQKNQRLIMHFREIGDLKLYIARFNTSHVTSKNAEALRALRLKTFEDIAANFLNVFSGNDARFFVDDLVIGDKCNSTDISIFSQTYNNRAGGILEGPLRDGSIGNITKISMGGSVYRNEWLEPNRSIKSFLQAGKDVFNEGYVANQRIIANPERPIFCFTRQGDDGPFTYNGVFSFGGGIR